MICAILYPLLHEHAVTQHVSVHLISHVDVHILLTQ